MFPYARIDEKQIEIIHIPDPHVIEYKNMVEMVLKVILVKTMVANNNFFIITFYFEPISVLFQKIIVHT